MKSAASVNTVRQAGSVRLTDMTTYRDILARRGIQPMRVERTVKLPADLVLDTWARPARICGNEFINRKGGAASVASPGKVG